MDKEIKFELSDKTLEIVKRFMIRNKLWKRSVAINCIIERHGGVD